MRLSIAIILLCACSTTTGRGSDKLNAKEKAQSGTRPSGQPCTQDLECASNACINIAGQSVCAAECTVGVACDGDLVCQKARPREKDSPTVCAEPAAGECSACTSDSDCGGVGRACLVAAEGTVCGIDCTLSDSACPLGFACIDLVSGDGVPLSRQCVPEPGVCFCAPGEEDNCTKWAPPVIIHNEDGSVTVQTTHPTPNPGNSHGVVRPGCTPKAETCNGIDDDCDGKIDEGSDGHPLKVACGFGSCGGYRTCGNGEMGECDAREPTTETCNGVDDDCDGETDEGFLDKADSCGACGYVCPGQGQDANLTRGCQQYGDHFECAPIQCKDNFYDADNALTNGCEATDEAAHAASDVARAGDKEIYDDNNDYVEFVDRFGGDMRAHDQAPYDRSHASYGAAFSTDWYVVHATDQDGGDMELRARLDVSQLPPTSLYEMCLSGDQGETFNVQYGSCGSRPGNAMQWCTGMCCCAYGGQTVYIPLEDRNTDPFGNDTGLYYARVAWKSGGVVAGQSMNNYVFRICDDGYLQTCGAIGEDCGKPRHCVY